MFDIDMFLYGKEGGIVVLTAINYNKTTHTDLKTLLR